MRDPLVHATEPSVQEVLMPTRLFTFFLSVIGVLGLLRKTEKIPIHCANNETRAPLHGA
jgi:hypothetical protein